MIATNRMTLALLALCGIQGCSSMSATYLGNPTEGQEVTGMPIVLERPRYLRVTVKDVSRQIVAARVAGTDASGRPANSGGAAALPGNAPVGAAPTSGDLSTQSVRDILLGDVVEGVEIEYETISVGEVYALDFKRPAAGTSEFEVEFADGVQYPSKVKAKSEDKTIAEVRETLGTVLDAIATGATPTSGQLEDAVFDSNIVARSIEVSSSIRTVLIFDLDQVGNPEYRPIQVFP